VEIESVGGKGTPVGEFCRFLAFTGCRKGEAAAVRWQDVDFARGVIRVAGTKTEAAAREVPIIPAARSLLERIRARREAVNKKVKHAGDIDPASSVLGVKEAQNSLTRACAKLGLPRLTHHDLRDAFATACIEAGVDIPTVAGWLGHADGGALLMRVYAHHRRAHSVAQAAKVNFGS
jgi:integrase